MRLIETLQMFGLVVATDLQPQQQIQLPEDSKKSRTWKYFLTTYSHLFTTVGVIALATGTLKQKNMNIYQQQVLHLLRSKR